MRRKVGKMIGQIVLLGILTAFALWFALREDGSTVIYQIQKLSYIWIFCIILMGILYYFIQGYILYEIAKKYKDDIHMKDGVCNAYIAAFFNGVTPLGGGQIAQTYAFRKLKISYGDIASILWKDFFLYQSVVIVYASILMVLGIFLIMPKIVFYYILAFVGFIINSSVIILLWTMVKFPNVYHKICQWIIQIGCKIKLVKNKEEVCQRWQHQMQVFTEQVKLLKKEKKMIIKAVFCNITRQTLYYLIQVCIIGALGYSLHIQDIAVILIMSCLIHMLNALTPLPGDSGWTESAFILLFSVILGRIDAGTVMILWRTSTYYVQILIGGIIFFVVKYRRITNFKP